MWTLKYVSQTDCELKWQTNKQINRNIRCQRCFHEWTYSGGNPYFTLCPRCRTTVSTRKKASQSVQVRGQAQTATTASKITNMNEYTSNRNKHYFSKPMKKLFRISDRTLVILDEKIVSQLGIAEEDNIWVEQILNDEGITLTVKKILKIEGVS